MSGGSAAPDGGTGFGAAGDTEAAVDAAGAAGGGDDDNVDAAVGAGGGSGTGQQFACLHGLTLLVGS